MLRALCFPSLTVQQALEPAVSPLPSTLGQMGRYQRFLIAQKLPFLNKLVGLLNTVCICASKCTCICINEVVLILLLNIYKSIYFIHIPRKCLHSDFNKGHFLSNVIYFVVMLVLFMLMCSKRHTHHLAVPQCPPQCLQLAWNM